MIARRAAKIVQIGCSVDPPITRRSLTHNVQTSIRLPARHRRESSIAMGAWPQLPSRQPRRLHVVPLPAGRQAGARAAPKLVGLGQFDVLKCVWLLPLRLPAPRESSCSADRSRVRRRGRRRGARRCEEGDRLRCACESGRFLQPRPRCARSKPAHRRRRARRI